MAPMSDGIDKRPYISERIAVSLQKRRHAQCWWSAATHGSTIIIIALSSIAAVIAKYNDSIASILSVIVTIVSGVQIKVGFERKLIANRLTQSALSQLEVDDNMGVDPTILAK